MGARNAAEWPPLWLSLFRPREYDRRAAIAEGVSRQWRESEMRRLNLRRASEQVLRLRYELSPEWRLELQQALAQWEAHLDSLDDDGVYAIPKGQE